MHQQAFFTEPSRAQLAAMRAAAEHARSATPQITPDNEVITGWERVLAMIDEGVEAIDVVERDDLLGDDDEIERLFVMDKLANCELSELRVVWCMIRRREAESGWRFNDDVPQKVRREIQAELHKRKGLGLRQVNRLIQIARLPAHVQQAVDAKTIRMTLACKIEGQPAEVQQEIDEQIRDRGLEHAREIAEHHLSEAPRDANADANNTDKFVRLVDRIVNEFCGHEENIRLGSRHLEKLQRVEQFLGNLSHRIKDTLAEQEKNMVAMIAEFTGPADDYDAQSDELGTSVTSVI